MFLPEDGFFDRQPPIVLADWKVLQVPSGDRHLCGRNVATQLGRVSTAIQTLFVSLLSAVTTSGRVYQMTGPPFIDVDSEFHLRTWELLTRGHASVDVTAEVWTSHVDAKRRNQASSQNGHLPSRN